MAEDPSMTGGGGAELAALLRLALEDGQALSVSEDELAVMLAQQLAAPLLEELGQMMGPSMAAAARPVAEAAQPPIRTLGELLVHPTPPMPLLLFAKEFASRSADHPSRPLPKPLARLLFLAVLKVARRSGLPLTAAEAAALTEGSAWAAGQVWLDETMKKLLAR